MLPKLIVYLSFTYLLLLFFPSNIIANTETINQSNEVETEANDDKTRSDELEFNHGLLDASPTVTEIYEILLRTKEDKIILLSNIVNWIIAIAAIVTTVVLAFFISFSRRLKKRTLELEDQVITSRKLINELVVTKTEIQGVQNDVKQILSSKEFSHKLILLEKTISNMNYSITRWEKFEREQTKLNDEAAKRSVYLDIKYFYANTEGNNFIERMNSDDVGIYNKISESVNELDKLDYFELLILREKLQAIYDEYSKTEDINVGIPV